MAEQAARDFVKNDVREEALPTFEVSDEALEVAGARGWWNMSAAASRDFTIEVSSPCCKR